jgi:hypothetical protein
MAKNPTRIAHAMTGTANAANRSSEQTKALVNAAKFAAA